MNAWAVSGENNTPSPQFWRNKMLSGIPGSCIARPEKETADDIKPANGEMKLSPVTRPASGNQKPGHTLKNLSFPQKSGRNLNIRVFRIRHYSGISISLIHKAGRTPSSDETGHPKYDMLPSLRTPASQPPAPPGERSHQSQNPVASSQVPQQLFLEVTIPLGRHFRKILPLKYFSASSMLRKNTRSSVIPHPPQAVSYSRFFPVTSRVFIICRRSSSENASSRNSPLSHFRIS